MDFPDEYVDDPDSEVPSSSSGTKSKEPKEPRKKTFQQKCLEMSEFKG